MHPMSADQPPTTLTAPAGLPQARPGAVTAAVATALAVGVLTLLTQLAGLLQGRAAIEDELNSQLGEDADLVGGLVAVAVDEAYGTIRVRAVLGIVLALAVVGLALAARGAALAARIGLVVTMLVSALLTMIVVADVFPTSGVLLGALALLLTPVAVVLLFLPPVNRYRAARRTSAA